MPEPDRDFVALCCDVLDHGTDTVRTYRCHHLNAPGPPPADMDALRDTNDRLRERLRARRSGSDGWLVYQALSVPVDRLLAALDDLLTDSAPAKVSA